MLHNDPSSSIKRLYHCFRLNSNLVWPFRRVVATVIHDFRPLESSQLALRPGVKVLVVSKEGDSRGWWKGRTLEKVTPHLILVHTIMYRKLFVVY